MTTCDVPTRRRVVIATAAVGVLGLAGCANRGGTNAARSTAENSMTVNNVAAVQAIYAAFGRGDVAAIQERVASGTQWDFNGGRSEIPWHKKVNSRAEVAGFLGSFMSAVEVERFEPREFIHSGPHVVVEVRLQYKVRSTGRQVTEDQLHWWSFDAEGRVARLRHFEDTAQVLAAVTGV